MPPTARADDYRLPSLDSMDGPSRLDALGGILAEAEEQGVIVPLPVAEDEARLSELHASRVRTTRSRLSLLGYMKDNRSPEVDRSLRHAIRRFQIDAGLRVDGWVGEKTWTALQELVSFEHPSNIHEYFDDGKPRDALVRAAKLRLFVLGLLDKKNPRKWERVEAALKRFADLAGILGLHPRPLTPALTPETLRVLFDQDGITERLGRAGADFTGHRPADMSKAKFQRVVSGFVVSVAKVELWLLGFDVTPDGETRFDVPPATNRAPPRRYRLCHALYQFWGFFFRSAKPRHELARRITPEFFRRLSRIQSDGSRMPIDSDAVYRTLARQDERTLGLVWDGLKSLGSRIWDGMKRVWSWFRAWFRSVGRQLQKWVTNLARLAMRLALGAFQTVRNLMKMVSTIASVLRHRTLPGSDVKHIVIHRDADFDYRVYVNPARAVDRVYELLDEFRTRAMRFAAGVRILGLLIDAIREVVRTGVLGGWLGLILSLVRVYSNLKKLKLVRQEAELAAAVV